MKFLFTHLTVVTLIAGILLLQSPSKQNSRITHALPRHKPAASKDIHIGPIILTKTTFAQALKWFGPGKQCIGFHPNSAIEWSLPGGRIFYIDAEYLKQNGPYIYQPENSLYGGPINGGYIIFRIQIGIKFPHEKAPLMHGHWKTWNYRSITFGTTLQRCIKILGSRYKKHYNGPLELYHGEKWYAYDWDHPPVYISASFSHNKLIRLDVEE